MDLVESRSSTRNNSRISREIIPVNPTGPQLWGYLAIVACPTLQGFYGRTFFSREYRKLKSSICQASGPQHLTSNKSRGTLRLQIVGLSLKVKDHFKKIVPWNCRLLNPYQKPWAISERPFKKSSTWKSRESVDTSETSEGQVSAERPPERRGRACQDSH